jgi:hypothetical protein
MFSKGVPSGAVTLPWMFPGAGAADDSWTTAQSAKSIITAVKIRFTGKHGLNLMFKKCSEEEGRRDRVWRVPTGNALAEKAVDNKVKHQCRLRPAS